MTEPRDFSSSQELVFLREVYDSADIGICVTDADRRFVLVNDAYCRSYGYAREELIGRPFTDVLPEAERELAGSMHDDFIAGGSESAGEWRVLRKDGAVRNVIVTAGRVHAPDGARYKVSTVQDISDTRSRELRLHQLSRVVEQTRHGVIFTDAEGLVTWVNDGTERMTGYALEEMQGRKPGDLLQCEKTDPDAVEYMHRQIAAGEGFQVDIVNRKRSGEDVWIHISCSPVMDRHGRLDGFMALQTDITEHRLFRRQIEELSYRDPLTGLANRRQLEERVNFCRASSRRTGEYNALLLLDLDNFKLINDAVGPGEGDKVLISVAKTLLETLYDSDLVARLGGDEFVVVLSNLSKDPTDATLRVERAAGRIVSSLAQPFSRSGLAHRVTASIGATLFAGAADSAETLMQKADIAMYQAKGAGRNTFAFFDPLAQQALVRRHRLEVELRDAIHSRQLIPYYQGQVDREGSLVGVELLIRWQHPQRGLLSPADFIPLAESAGMIADLGWEVLRLAVVQWERWAARQATARLPISVNISPTHFELPDFAARASDLIPPRGAGSSTIKFEITESALARDVDDLVRSMTGLRALGVSFSLDDFGTGYSSLAYLKRLPIEQIKIDQGFVRDILLDENDRGITETIIALAKTLNMDVIAEGVESEAQRDLLIELGCEKFQGYLFDRPSPIHELEERYGLAAREE